MCIVSAMSFANATGFAGCQGLALETRQSEASTVQEREAGDSSPATGGPHRNGVLTPEACFSSRWQLQAIQPQRRRAVRNRPREKAGFWAKARRAYLDGQSVCGKTPSCGRVPQVSIPGSACACAERKSASLLGPIHLY